MRASQIMELKLVALYGRKPSRVGADAGSRALEFGLKAHEVYRNSHSDVIEASFDVPEGWFTIDGGTRELVYSGPPIHTVVPAAIEFNVDADMGTDHDRTPLHLFSVGVLVRAWRMPGARIGSRAMWCADSLIIINSYVESIDLRGTPVCDLTVRRCKHLETIHAIERLESMHLSMCYELKRVDGVGQNLDTLYVGTVNSNLRIEGISRFSSALKYLHMNMPIASIPFVPVHLIKQAMTDWTYKEKYSHTIYRMRVEREHAAKLLFMVWHARLGGGSTNPTHPNLLKCAFEFLYCI